MEFLARAGPRFLRSYHRAWIDSPHKLALAVVDDRGAVVGVLLGSIRPAEHYRAMVRRHGLILVTWLVLRAASHPGFARELLTTRVPRYVRGLFRVLLGQSGRTHDGEEKNDEGSVVHEVHGPNEKALGEVAHVMITPDLQAHGLGRLLLEEARREAEAAGIRGLELVTPPDLDARTFYEHLGWQAAGEVTSRSGEVFLRYRLVIDGGPQPEPAPTS
jgi:GNAT superfamily N-acetyltransferase